MVVDWRNWNWHKFHFNVNTKIILSSQFYMRFRVLPSSCLQWTLWHRRSPQKGKDDIAFDDTPTCIFSKASTQMSCVDILTPKGNDLTFEYMCKGVYSLHWEDWVGIVLPISFPGLPKNGRWSNRQRAWRLFWGPVPIDDNPWQLTNLIDWFSDHPFPSIWIPQARMKNHPKTLCFTRWNDINKNSLDICNIITLLRRNTDIMDNQKDASIHIFTSLMVYFSCIQTILLSIAVLRDWFLNIPHFPNFSVNVWDFAWKLVGMVWTVGRWLLWKK